MIYKLSVLTGLLLFCFSCQFKQKESDFETSLKYIPQYHFSPPKGWMNDPNGMVYFEGEYHLFYQHYPDGLTWGPMHWGHAVSTDLIYWEHLPIALYPDELGYIFSGSAVVDVNNTSGLGTSENPPMVAIYTYHNMPMEREGKAGFQYQGIAYSLDKGRNWIKYKGNPVLQNPELRDFRDPKVSWNEVTKKWIMVLAVKDHVSFYSSPDLIQWDYESDFGYEIGAHGGVWECPDLFKIKDETGLERWILLVSINPGGPNSGSATQYFIGDFDGHSFKQQDSTTRWVDYGTDNYAGVIWSGLPSNDGRIISIGWMNNWNYANQIPESGERGAFTLPREFFLSGDNLGSRPLKEVESIQKEEVVIESLSEAFELNCASMSINITLDPAKLEKALQFVLTNNLNEKVSIEIGKQFMIVDRSESGNVAFSEKFNGIIKTPLDLEVRELQLFIDRTSVEVFVNSGVLVSTQLVFPTVAFSQGQFKGDTQSVKSVELTGLISTIAPDNQE